MATLNRIPAAVARRHGVRAATDVTGFGLAGHAANVARESRLTLEIRLADLPLLPGALELCRALPAGRPQGQPPAVRAAASRTRPRRTRRSRALLYDPQTSGGLLLLVPAAAADALLADLPRARHRARGSVARAVPSPSSRDS